MAEMFLGFSQRMATGDGDQRCQLDHRIAKPADSLNASLGVAEARSLSSEAVA